MDQILSIESAIRTAQAEKKICIALFIDLSKAYDSVWHKGLIFKLQQIGIKGHLLAWLKEYLQGRTFKVFFEGEYSVPRKITTGVPQGAILSPLLFNVMTRDIPKISGVTISEFADDICFYIVGSGLPEIQSKFQNQINVFYAWTKDWGLNVNINKTKAMMFTNKRTPYPPLSLNGSPIEYVRSHRYLGMFLDSPKLTWKDHIQKLADGCISRVNILKMLSNPPLGSRSNHVTQSL